MQKYLFKNIQVVNEGKIKTQDVLTHGDRIERIDAVIDPKQMLLKLTAKANIYYPVLSTTRYIFVSRALRIKPPFIPKARQRLPAALPVLWKCPIPSPMH
jgi:dihydroorotase